MSSIPFSERTRFLSQWLDYVLELGGAEDEAQALAYYADQRNWLVAQIESGTGILLHRALLVPDEVDPSSYAGTTRDLGRYWTMDRGVAHDWRPGGDYGDVPTPASGTMHVVSTRITSLEQIDLVETIACQIGSEWEKEVRLAPGHRPLICGVEAQSPRNLSSSIP